MARALLAAATWRLVVGGASREALSPDRLKRAANLAYGAGSSAAVIAVHAVRKVGGMRTLSIT
jgi:hypothetical protein